MEMSKSPKYTQKLTPKEGQDAIVRIPKKN